VQTNQEKAEQLKRWLNLLGKKKFLPSAEGQGMPWIPPSLSGLQIVLDERALLEA
jgi:hypothetical protein